MKKCALVPALVLAISTVTWGYHITGISVTPANPIGADSIGIVVSVPSHFDCFIRDRMTHVFPVSSGCSPSPCHTRPGCWCPCPWGNNSGTTSSTSSSSTMATGPSGSAIAQTIGRSVSGGSSSSSSSFSESIAK